MATPQRGSKYLPPFENNWLICIVPGEKVSLKPTWNDKYVEILNSEQLPSHDKRNLLYYIRELEIFFSR